MHALTADRSDPRDSVVIVPTGGAARQLRIVFQALGSVCPLLVTREELLRLLRERLAEAPRWLTPFERDGIAQVAAAAAEDAVPGLSFQLRPGLVAEMLRFYDELRRQMQLVGRFEELIEQTLTEDASDIDRAVGRMLRQTRFLAQMFREYEKRVAGSGACDEHTLRDRLIEEPGSPPLRHVVVTVSDWIADPAGLFASDFDLLARMPGLQAVDIVSTEAILRSGFDERLHNWLPELEELPDADLLGAEPPHRPTLVSPPTPDRTWFTFRDREEELVAIARRIKGDARRRLSERGRTEDTPALPGGHAFCLDRSAIVFKHPLPYLYVAPQTLGAARIPYQTADALPLASEPTAAALDLLLEFIETGFGRDAIVSLLSSPHFGFGRDGARLTHKSIGALNRVLGAARYLGGLPLLEQIADGCDTGEALPALQTARALSRELAPIDEPAPASTQLRRITTFFATNLRPLDDGDPFARRERLARAAVLDVLDRLAEAHSAHHDPLWTVEQVASEIRRWIEQETFDPGTPGGGVHLIDDQAARFGAFDDLALVGLVEHEWPEQRRRNIFYPVSLLRALGWPRETDRRAAEDARFLDLLQSASRSVSVSTFVLDDERLVMRSAQLDEIPRAQLSAIAAPRDDHVRVFRDEGLSLPPLALAGLEETPRDWAQIRTSRPPADAHAFHGHIGPPAPRPWSISALETYLQCPFKFLAQYLLRLEEEPADGEVMDPRQQGRFVHGVFEAFFRTWHERGRRGITPENLDDARAMFAEIAESELTRLPASEAGLERTRLLGSAAAVGLGETVLRMEAERPTAVVERLLEQRLQGEFTIDTSSGPRVVRLDGKADRLDLLEDGTFRLLDYKLGWPPSRPRALQLPIYALCAEQRLGDARGRRWTLGEAAYVAFKGPKRFVPLFSSGAERDKVLADAQQRLSDTLDAIGRGEFPPRPDDVFRCETCSFAGVCRKDYA